MSAFKFFAEFLSKPGPIGAVSPSSKHLAEIMTGMAQVERASTVVEYGPGTGAITGVITKKLRPECEFLAIEINSDFVTILRKRFPDVNVIEDSALNTAKYLRQKGLSSCDSIICGLPLSSFDDDLQDAVLSHALEVLRPGGRFVTFTYLMTPLFPGGRKIRTKLFDQFDKVERTPIVWKNFPPAFIYCVEKRSEGVKP